VVDNGSRDDTPAVLAEAARRLPLTAFTEPSPGTNRALPAPGARLSFTDDDVELARLAARLVEASRRWPDAAILGGPVVPRYLPGAPAGSCRTRRGRAPPPAPQAHEGSCPRLPLGPVTRVRAAALAGRRLTTPGLCGGATDLAARRSSSSARARGRHGCPRPHAVVGHVVEPHPLEPCGFRRAAFCRPPGPPPPDPTRRLPRLGRPRGTAGRPVGCARGSAGIRARARRALPASPLTRSRAAARGSQNAAARHARPRRWARALRSPSPDGDATVLERRGDVGGLRELEVTARCRRRRHSFWTPHPEVRALCSTRCRWSSAAAPFARSATAA
jgi:hypothetical protein